MTALRYFAFLAAITSSSLLAQSAIGSNTLNTHSGQQFPARSVGIKCIALSGKFVPGIRECAVSKAEDLGVVGGKRYRYALYCILANWVPADVHCNDGSHEATTYKDRALVLFVQTPGKAIARVVWHRVANNIGDLRFEPPQLVSTKAETLLYLPVRVDGTGAFNESEYYLWKPSGWAAVDGEAWMSDPKFAIPPGFELWKSIWPNLRTMTAEFGLYRQDDPYCCPSGPIVKAKLAIRSNKLALESFALEERKPDQ